MKPFSLRRQLLIATNLVVIAVLAVAAWLNYQMTRHELDEVFDAELAQTTRLLKSLIHDPAFLDRQGSLRVIELPQLPHNIIAEGDERQQDGHPYERKLAFQVWSADGELLLTTENAVDAAVARPEAGYHEVMLDDGIWLGFSYFDVTTQSWIYTAQRQDVRSELTSYITNNQRWILLLTWLPLSLAILLTIVWFLRPVRHFTTQLQQRAADDLRPLQAHLPSELIPIQANINTLFERIGAYLEREKNFIADASHELRTPLAALQLHAAQIDPDNPESIRAIQRATVRLTHLVNQLLLLTKLEGSRLNETQLSLVKLDTLVHEALTELPRNQLQQCEWQLRLDATGPIKGLPTLLTVMLRNLLQNATKYSGRDGQVSIISFRNEQDELVLCIEDNGPGVPDDDMERLGERFYRHPGTRHHDGAGLGLSIVRRIADLHGFKLSFATAVHGGLRVCLNFKRLDDCTLIS